MSNEYVRQLARRDRDAELCSAYWTWLYAERRRTGQEPTPQEKAAHPTAQAIDAFRGEQP